MFDKRPNAVVVKFIRLNQRGKQWIYPKPYIFKISPQQADNVKVNDVLKVRYNKGGRVPVKVVEVLTLSPREARKHKAILVE